MSPAPLRHGPIIILALMAACLGERGLASSAAGPILEYHVVRLVLSAALHAVWLVPELRDGAPLAAVGCWLVCLRLAALGLPGDSFFLALFIEAVPALLGLAVWNPRPFAERLESIRTAFWRWRLAVPDLPRRREGPCN
jgi:hypothetical protein